MALVGDANFTASIAPWLSVPDGDAALDFYTRAFGAVELEQLPDETGHIVVAQLALGQARFWLQQDVDSSPAALGGISVRMIVIVDDPDGHFARAVAGSNPSRINAQRAWVAHGASRGSVRAPLGICDAAGSGSLR